MNLTLISFAIYAFVAFILVSLVGRALFQNGKIFLFDIFKGDTELTSAVNRLLLIGFYLINIGFVLLTYSHSHVLSSWIKLIEKVSMELGTIIFSLGIIHMLNIILLLKMRKKSEKTSDVNREIKPINTITN